jgi:NAD(P)-dependent dehydrogenase (short-subunit alcohol dehydrogenase family)
MSTSNKKIGGTKKVYLVTGAGSGIGAAAIRLLLADSAYVCAADWKEVPIDGIAKKHLMRLKTVKCDVSKEVDCNRAVAETVAAFGSLHSLIHFAGIHSVKKWDELDAMEFARLYAINVTGSFLMAQAAARYMKDHGGGAIVLTGSTSTITSGVGGEGRGGLAYTCSKGAIVALNRGLAKSLGQFGIRVNAVSPGATTTAMTADYTKKAVAEVGRRSPLGRIGRPEEIAAVAIFLASDAPTYMTGEIVNSNGGSSFGH